MAGQVLDTKKYSYNRIKLKSPDRKTIYSANNADAVSRAMLSMTKDELIETAELNGMTDRLKKHFTKRNGGHLRMIVGQALRSQLHKSKPVVIRGVTIDRLDQVVPWPFGYVEHAVKKRVKK